MVSGSKINNGGFVAVNSIEDTIKELNEVIKNINKQRRKLKWKSMDISI